MSSLYVQNLERKFFYIFFFVAVLGFDDDDDDDEDEKGNAGEFPFSSFVLLVVYSVIIKPLEWLCFSFTSGRSPKLENLLKK